ncbi:hypothetical protein PY365_18580 [Roseiarcaceae bacterium H3SJ34-1]|uniref:hypothetical protein n=1 Tax=Terripilifer ovatus TaxID=3032367 RepID=UPI003AB984B7|nr:hypothetical protein [Roseiarcaceae bacterium H3SJ34-1]
MPLPFFRTPSAATDLTALRSLFVEFGIEMLESRGHLGRLDRRNIFVGQIDGPNDPTIAAGRLARVDRTGAGGGVLVCFA